MMIESWAFEAIFKIISMRFGAKIKPQSLGAKSGALRLSYVMYTAKRKYGKSARHYMQNMFANEMSAEMLGGHVPGVIMRIEVLVTAAGTGSLKINA